MEEVGCNCCDSESGCGCFITSESFETEEDDLDEESDSENN